MLLARYSNVDLWKKGVKHKSFSVLDLLLAAEVEVMFPRLEMSRRELSAPCPDLLQLRHDGSNIPRNARVSSVSAGQTHFVERTIL